MNKSDLKDGMMLKLRNNNIYSLLHGYLLELSLDDTYKIIASMDDYDDEFKNCNKNLEYPHELDVMKVYDKDMNELWNFDEIRLVDLLSELDNNCYKITEDNECDAYDDCEICKISYILNNYEVKRKVDTQ